MPVRLRLRELCVYTEDQLFEATTVYKQHYDQGRQLQPHDCFHSGIVSRQQTSETITQPELSKAEP